MSASAFGQINIASVKYKTEWFPVCHMTSNRKPVSIFGYVSHLYVDWLPCLLSPEGIVCCAKRLLELCLFVQRWHYRRSPLKYWQWKVLELYRYRISYWFAFKMPWKTNLRVSNNYTSNFVTNMNDRSTCRVLLNVCDLELKLGVGFRKRWYSLQILINILTSRLHES